MIPLSVPNLTGNEKKYLIDCIDSTFVSSVGEYVNRFEELVAKATGSSSAVATSSGTTGLHAALTAAGVGRDDLVIIPAFTFIATANSVRHCGADPWLFDIRHNDWCLDPDAVKHGIESECELSGDGLIHKKTGRRVSAIMPVHTLGNMPDMDKFNAIAKEYSLVLIADAACSIGAAYHGKPFGELADLSVLSFNGNKTVTCGGGGAVVGRNRELLDHVRHLTTTARVWPDYDFDEAGFNYRMTNIQAAVGCAQMERAMTFVETKRRIRRFYEKELSGLKNSGISFFPETEGSSCWFSGIVLPEGKTLDDSKKVCSALKERDIEARTFWKPVHLQLPYEDSPHEDLVIAESLWQRIIALPCSSGISEEELETVARAINEILG
ncbi:MAG: aminotransferase class I/II-fold pyridoxal phosphate-dependent enzyme [Lachnospiraceae bacterium]|nr:aminotransferase class I/II-fold pyridoxal phosphate-dependent enzyme [Lachnospiraceae bacterium]